ncbi:unnamed protein product [[Actinomadura] parvosata subsp. kistnae]|uniref:hypothetical protein n=1 Tax=[Actinomadura] parvosata TaxID=1955412 RepID=UPI000D2B6B67|nr:unnamed protein product [Actinomadura parvosata subsp. kistnae]
MKLATAPGRRLIVAGTCLAVAAAALPALPGLAESPVTRLAAASTPQGTYWHTRVLSRRDNFRQVGSRANPYWVVQQRLIEQWHTTDGRGWTGYREAGAYPKSAKDRQAWQRDGSPAKWTRDVVGQTVVLSTRPTRGHVTPIRGQNTQFFLLGQYLTYEEVQRLPADPAALKAWLTKAAQVRAGRDTDSFIAGLLPDLLYRLPAPKQVRAAAYQVLLTLPGVHAEGAARDDLGRNGTALSIDQRQATGPKDEQGKITRRLIVDTAGMVLLSDAQKAERPGVDNTDLVLHAGWTNAAPAVPALP